MDHFFSPSTGGFYSEAVHGPRLLAEPLTEKQVKAGRTPKYKPNPVCKIPADAIAVAAKTWEALLAAQGEGQTITVQSGRAVAVDPAMPSAEEQLAAIRAKRDRLLAATDVMLAVPDYPITDSQRAQLLDWREALRGFPAFIENQLPLPEVQWPPRPIWIGDKGEKL